MGDRIRSVPKFFLGKKKVKKSRVTSLPFPFPHKELPDRRQFVTSLTFKMESRERIIFVDSDQAIRPQHTINPASLMRPAGDSAVDSASGR